MNPFDEMTPEEKSPENQEMLDLLRRYSTHPAPAQSASAEQARILAHARARLLYTNAAMLNEEMQQLPEHLILMPLPASTPPHIARKRHASQSIRIFSTIAAAIALVILLGASLLVFVRYASHRVPTVKYTSTVVSTHMSTVQPTVQPLRTCQLGADVGLMYVCEHHLYQDISLAKKMGDYTVTIEQGYADASRIVFFYTIYKGKTNVSRNVQATMILSSDQVADLSHGNILQSFKQGGLVTFDIDQYMGRYASPIPLRLQLEVQNILASEDGNIVNTPVTFNITIAYHSQFALRNLQQRVTVSNIQLTLTQIVVSLSAVEVIFTNDSSSLTIEGTTLSVNGKTCEPLSSIASSHLYTNYIGCPLYQQRGMWTLTVTGFVLSNGKPPGTQVVWVFHVQAPA